MFISDCIKKIKFDISADRIGPDAPFTHWRLYFRNKMIKLCQKKFKKFHDTAEVRPGAYIVGCSKIEIGKRVVIRPGCRFFGETYDIDTSIIIDDDVMLGSCVSIYINNHCFERTDIPIIDQGHYPAKQVHLKQGCWIGANVILLPGVTVGKNSVIGAGSVVTKSIPDFSIAVGNPAKIISIIQHKEA